MENVKKQKIRLFDVDHGIFFTRETGFFKIILLIFRTGENIKNKLSHS